MKVYGPAAAIGRTKLTCGAEVAKRQRAEHDEEAHRDRLEAFIHSDASGRSVPSGGPECSHSVYRNLRHYR